MKKLIFALCVCAGLCACSSDDDLISSTSTSDLDGSVAYLTVNLKDVGSATRATADGGFVYGTEKEQQVNNAYFYFYDKDGAYMAKGSLGSVSGTASSETTPGNIEWKSNTIVAVYGLEDPDNLPTQMLTVLNKPTGVDLTNQDLSTALTTLASTPWGEDGNFVMSTSVYSYTPTGGSATIINTTALTEDDFSTEPVNISEDYPNGGVPVYVERLAAKVSVTDNVTTEDEDEDGYIDITDYVAESFINGAPEGGVYVKLLGFDVDCIARDAYISKNIQDDSAWSGFSFVWNDADDFRSYWAESPNYGVSHNYPTSSLGNTDADEDTTPLDTYLRYVSLSNPVEFGSAAYCGENTNTAGTDGVITAIDNTGLTNVLVKGQVYTKDASAADGYAPLSIVEFHGLYYTADDFCQTVVDDVVEYDYTYVINDVIDALKKTEAYATEAEYLEELKAAILTDYIYVTPAVDGHKNTSSPNVGIMMSSHLDGSLLSLYNDVDGNVKIFNNMTTPPQWGDGDKESFTNIDNTLMAKYPASDIVYGGADLDDYEFWFHIDSAELENLGNMGLMGTHVFQIPSGSGDYYMAIDNSISFYAPLTDDHIFPGEHYYTLRNYFLRALTVEADGIDSKFGSHYPNFFNNGLMYYNVPIEHLGLSSTTTHDLTTGDYGVVRNHYYDITINSLSNLGRGIANEKEVIVPQPEATYYYLGADINILSWNMLNQEVGF